MAHWLAASLLAAALAGGQELASGPASRLVMNGDRLRIAVAESPDFNRVYAVAGDGSIDLPLVGRVVIADLSTEQAAEKIRTLLEQSFFKKASVSVQVAEFVEGAIILQGAVKNPGSIPFKGDQILTLVEAIAMSGGLAADADGTHVHILRWRPGRGMERDIITVDVQGMMETFDFSRDHLLRPRDMIIVPVVGGGGSSRGGEFLALGEVARPGFHPVSEGLDIIRAVTRIGGLGSQAHLAQARILRPGADGGFQVVPVNLERLLGAADVSYNVPVQPGDILFVPSLQHAARGRIYLLGSVGRPGSYPLGNEGESTLAKVLLTAGVKTVRSTGINAGSPEQFADLAHIKILRTAPGGSKQTMIVNVEKIFDTGSFEEDVPLRDEDVVIVPEKLFSF